MRENRSTGKFLSQIPEDVKETLVNYLLYARFSESESSGNFQEVIEKFDERIGVIFVKSFMFLVDAYSDAVDSTAWGLEPGSVSGEDTVACMEERLEFLCSVANDLRRIEQSQLFVLEGELSALLDRDAVIVMKATSSAKVVAVLTKVGECIANVLIRIVATDPLWTNPNSHVEWLGGNRMASESTTATTATSGTTTTTDAINTANSFADQMTDVGDLLAARIEYLDAFCAYKVLMVCISKVIGRYLFMLKCAQDAHRHVMLSGKDVISMLTDIQAVKDCFGDLMHQPALAMYADAVLSQAKFLDHALALITFDKESDEFELTLQSLLKISQGHPECALSFAGFVECCLRLRQDCETPRHVAKDLKRRGSVIAMLGMATESPRSVLQSSQGVLDARSQAMLDLIRDCYEPNEDAHAVFSNPVADIFADNQKFSISNFLFGLKSVDSGAMSIRRQHTILGNVFSILGSTSGSSSSVEAAAHASSVANIHAQAGLQDQIVISSIVCRNLLCISGKPKAFLVFAVDGVTAKTSVKEGSSTTWTEDITFHVQSISTRQSGISCTLYYMGKIYGDESVASVVIPLTSLAICDMNDETYTFDSWKSPKAKAAADKVILLGADLPTISLSISVVR